MQEETPNETPRQDTSPAQPVDASPASAKEQPAPVGQAQAETPQGEDVSQEAPVPEEDVAPDADEPGDDETPAELAGQAQDSPDQPDEVNQEG